MTECHGPCDQGRRSCPTPWACEKEEPPEQNIFRVVLGDVAIAAALMAVVALVVWSLV